MTAKGRKVGSAKRRRGLIGRAALAAVALGWGARALSANVTSAWVGNSGNWSDPTKWANSPAANTFPRNGNLGNTYDVAAGTSFTVNLDVDVTVNNLSLNPGGIVSSTSNRSLTVNDTFTFSRGYLFVPVTIPVGGQLKLVSPRDLKQISRVITLGGTLSLADTSPADPYNAIATSDKWTGAGIKVLPTGVFTIDRELRLIMWSTEPYFEGGVTSATLENAGLIDQRAGTPFRVGPGWAIANSGTMRVGATFSTGEAFSNTGLFELTSGSASAALGYGGTISGSVRLAAGSTLTFKGTGLNNNGQVVPHLLSNVSFSNSGTISIGSRATVKVATPLTIPGAISIATSSARLVLGAATTFSGPAVFDGGTIGVAYGDNPGATNRLTATDFTFKSGTLDRTELSIPAGGVLTLSGGGNRQLMASKVIVGGVANWSAGSIEAASVAGGTARSTLQVLAGGTLNVPPSAAVSFNSALGVLNNAGVINIDRGSLSNAGGWSVINSGTINIDRGSLSNVGTWSGVINSGTIRVSAAAIRLGIGAMTNGGRVELENGSALAVNGASVQSVRDLIASGVIDSSSVRADPTTTLAVVSRSSVNIPFDWRGLEYGFSDVLVVHTKFGDSNMDGRVDFADLVRVAQMYDSRSFKLGWGDGDFNYDGKVNFPDLVWVAQNYDTSVGGVPAVAGASADFTNDLAAAFASVPEPGGAVLLLLAGCGLAGRRRRVYFAGRCRASRGRTR